MYGDNQAMVDSPDVHMRRTKALSDEVDAASSLFKHGFSILLGYKFAATDADPLFVCLAGGSEKLLKLTLGLHGLDVNGRWPAAVIREYGHKITELDAEVQNQIRAGVTRSTASGYINQLLADVAKDPHIGQILLTFERYARHGRFYNLDYLGDNAHIEPSPAELWEQMHQALLRSRPDLVPKLASEQWEVARREVNQAIETSVRLWCSLISRSWMTGIFGQQAQLWSGQLDLHR